VWLLSITIALLGSDERLARDAGHRLRAAWCYVGRRAARGPRTDRLTSRGCSRRTPEAPQTCPEKARTAANGGRQTALVGAETRRLAFFSRTSGPGGGGHQTRIEPSSWRHRHYGHELEVLPVALVSNAADRVSQLTRLLAKTPTIGPSSCHLRAIHGGCWRRLTVTHGHSGHFDLRPRLYRSRTTRMVRMGSPVRFRRGGSTPRLTSVSAGQFRVLGRWTGRITETGPIP
jgi:hypothetical protein